MLVVSECIVVGGGLMFYLMTDVSCLFGELDVIGRR